MAPEAPLWGGRFGAPPATDLIRLTSSLSFDIALLPYDLAATKAHARTLAAASLLSEEDVPAVDNACDAILEDQREQRLQVHPEDEDVHSLVERELTERLGEVGRRIHAGRSRNDLVATDLRLWCRDATDRLTDRLCSLLGVLSDTAARETETVIPGYTHLQRAQPVTLSFHLLAHAFALVRDGVRLDAARKAADVSALGAGALAGNTLDLNAEVPAHYLDLSALFDNAMDAVADRDFACDLVYACSLTMVHLSRLAEDIVLWASSEYSFVRLADEWSTGSSMMPQKRNPDVAELTRGRAAAAIGDVTTLLALLKSQPLAYNRDLQEDKPVVFGAVKRTEASLEAMASLLGSLTFDREAMAVAASSGTAWATDVAEALVARGVPFRDAHHATGRLVSEFEKNEGRLEEEALASIHPLLRVDDVPETPLDSVRARSSRGGPAPERVAEQIELLQEKIGALRQSR